MKGCHKRKVSPKSFPVTAQNVRQHNWKISKPGPGEMRNANVSQFTFYR